MSFLVRLVGRGSKRKEKEEAYVDDFYGNYFSGSFFSARAGMKGGKAKRKASDFKNRKEK